MDVIDLRSDFLARPNAAMREAAQRAAAGPQCFGLREDPRQRELEARLAALCGQQDALIFPTCTMANTAALMLAAPPGSIVLTQPDAHVLVAEAGAATALGGLQLMPVDPAADGVRRAMPDPACWREALTRPADPQRAAVRLCVLENSHNQAGGVALPLDYVREVTALARAQGIGLHLDGARLAFAAGALGLDLAALAGCFDTVSLSLNKAFGAPVAAVLAGRADTIARALTLRQRLGGGLRPVAAACAATLAGLDGLTDVSAVLDLARRLAEGLQDCPGLAVLPVRPRTNLVLVEPDPPERAATLLSRLEARGVRAVSLARGRIRFAVYRGITAEQIERTIAAVRDAAA